jgi:pimeloyl-ACP methyl ester carboxylesterase
MRRRIPGDGIELDVLDEGEGVPVLLVHGFPDSSRLWRGQIPALTGAGLRAIAPDMPGFGASDKPGAVDAYGLGRPVADLAAVLDALGIERARVVGHDWGAAVAWVFAAIHPDRVERLVAMSVGHPGARQRSVADREKAWYQLLFQFEGVAEELLRRDDWALLREWLRDAPDADRYVEDLARPGALTAGLNGTGRTCTRRASSSRARRSRRSRRRHSGSGAAATTTSTRRRWCARPGPSRARGATSGSTARATGCSSTRPST